MIIGADISFSTIAVAIFFVLNATGEIPFFLALLSRFDHKRQLKIICREYLVALVVLLLFTFFGDDVLNLLGITRPILGVAGGVLLFLISLSMIFPKKNGEQEEAARQEPMIIPLAIPLVAGPGTIATVMLYSHETGSVWVVSAALIAAWIPSLIILLLGSYIQKLLGEKGLMAIERLGGMLVCLIGMQMFISNTLLIVKEYFQIGA